MSSREVFVVGGARVPFVKSMTDYMGVKSQDLMTASLLHLIRHFKLEGQKMGDVALGAVMNSSSNWNLARECVLGTPLHPQTPAFNLQRACGTSLEAAGLIALKIAAGQIESGIAGGVDTNSDLPIEVSETLAGKLIALNQARTLGERLAVIASLRPADLKPRLPAVVEPRTKLSMGQHTEKMVKEWKVSRSAQDALALASHQSAARAYDEGFYEDLVFEFRGLKRDRIVRGDTTLEKLAKLKPAFDRSEAGTLTAGNSSPLTDGSAAVLLASGDEAQRRGWPKLAKFIDMEVAAVDFVEGEGLLIAPAIAVSRMLERQKLKLQDFDYYEIHEAFAGQVLCTLRAWESPEYSQRVLGRATPLGSIDRAKMNVRGGSLALGHPFAATGARLVAALAKTLSLAGPGKRGLISVCTAGGMGVAAILES
ncbi:MAG TPA: acetyl-CoA C-acetyltransferase [Pseudobdellovibrionaceae bacterium]|nr:acetyl-CoA C-acetyltransferase [Pseudobdellovibrionaceae bacterium]